MTEVWTKWEGQVINGVFPLLRVLSASDHTAVFLTEYKAQNLPNAALKLVPVNPMLAQAQLSHWTTAAALSHPHLIRLFEVGRCQLGDLPFLFVVMEHAEQNLSQILPRRALTPDEVQEMLLPTLNALAFLHGKNLVQGQLKPSNILAVDDRLKLASDSIHPTGESRARVAKRSVYDPPETKDGSFSAAGDIWGLGITLVEALTQHPPSWPDSKLDTPSFSAPLPPMFAEIARKCLNRNPAERPTVADLEARIKPAPPVPVVSLPQPPVLVPEPPASAPQPPVSVPQPPVSAPRPPVSLAEPPVSPPRPPASAPPPLMSAPQPRAPTPQSPARAAPDTPAPPEASPKQRLFVPAIAVLLIVAVAVWAGLHLRSSRNSLEAPAPSAAASQNPETPQPAPPEIPAPSTGVNPADAKSTGTKSPASRHASRPSDQRAQPSANGSASVLHEEIPDVPRHARNTIRGHIQVAVRVTVDSSGDVVGETLEIPGPSRYFARLATTAARKWKFAPDNQNPRRWLLRFGFSRGGATVHAVRTY